MADLEGLDPSLRGPLEAMLKEAGGKITINSGYRSPERQAQLYAAAIKKYGSAQAARKWVAPPGHSNHNKGAAVDLGGDLKLAHQLAAKYGLAFPMSWEPWHIEHAGQRANSSHLAYTTNGDGLAAMAPPNVSPEDAAGHTLGNLLDILKTTQL